MVHVLTFLHGSLAQMIGLKIVHFKDAIRIIKKKKAYYLNVYGERLNTQCLMKVLLNLFWSVWVFECDVIGAIVKNLCYGCCLFGYS